ncbi:MAG: long-chain fatty acid--CoA ligase [Lentimicrobiaceae bacterium]|nr:long-chain fatty acid--CoA ligase [Lentimicrobiaceae bacterium]
MNKSIKLGIQGRPDVPSRLFDLVPRYIEKYGYKDCLFAGKVDRQWVKYDGHKFYEMTNSISHGLLKLGIKRGDRIALVATNAPEWNMIDFAIQQVGAICVPIYPTVSHADYEHIFKHSETSLVFITNKHLYNKVSDIIASTPSIKDTFLIRPSEGLKSLQELIELGNENRDEAALEARKAEVKNEDVATIIYTSGTMGTPKGVMLTHQNILSVVEYLCPLYPIDETHDALSYLPLSHIYERAVQYCHIYLGCTTYYVDNIGAIIDTMAEVKPQHFTSVPRLIEKVYHTIVRKGHKLKGIKKTIFFWALNLAERYDETKKHNGWFYLQKLKIADKLVFKEWRKVFGGNLELIISGGAAIQPRLTKIFTAIGIQLSEGYGLTETSPVIASNSLTLGKLKSGTVGVVMDNQEVVIAENGEILVKGPNVMLGYYKDEEKTREAIDENGYFHTGDKGCFDEDGLLKITGRIKEIFKTSMGKYVSPVLIENKIKESPFIGEMLVIGEGQKFAAALIYPNFEHLKSWCNIKGITYTTDEEMIKNKDVIMRFRKEIDKYNATLGDYEQVKKFELIAKEWTIESGEMTASLKPRRSKIMQNYADLVNKIYAE